jgi:hypothetical protein
MIEIPLLLSHLKKTAGSPRSPLIRFLGASSNGWGPHVRTQVTSHTSNLENIYKLVGG